MQEAAGSTKFSEAGSGRGSNFSFLWKQEADAEAVLNVLLPLPFLPNIMLTFFNRCNVNCQKWPPSFPHY